MQKYDPLVPGADVPYISVYRYDKEGDELIPLNSQTYLSGNVASAVDYNYDKGYLLLVAYSDGNIDMLYEDGRLVNLPGLMLSSDLKKEYQQYNVLSRREQGVSRHRFRLCHHRRQERRDIFVPQFQREGAQCGKA